MYSGFLVKRMDFWKEPKKFESFIFIYSVLDNYLISEIFQKYVMFT